MVNINDEMNLLLADDVESVDAANAEFYSKFPYPWPPMTFPRLDDPDFETVMLNQSLGDFTHRTIPADGNIWVAGCGTNQAVYTALRFPRASVVGSDISPGSLDMARRNADALDIANLELRQESLNHVTYRERFDYVLNTGVIHHNAEPERPLATLARALRPDGVLELMVYNLYHRTATTAFQKAVRTFSRHGARTASYEEEIAVARAFAATEPMASRPEMRDAAKQPDAHFADAYIQPVEHSYTVESLDALALQCGLQMQLPCPNQFDQALKRTWNLSFAAPAIQAGLEALPDVVRWQIANLLLMRSSPMLWFYFRHQRSPRDAHYERLVNEQFLNRVFVAASTTLRNYVRGPQDVDYKPARATVKYPLPAADELVRSIVDRADGHRTMRQILSELGVETASQRIVGDLRMQTTTPLTPYLRAVA